MTLRWIRDIVAVVALLLAHTAAAQDQQRAQLTYRSIREARIEGQAWANTKAPFDRLPAKAEGVVRDPVWNLSRHSAGIVARFVTDAAQIDVRWTLKQERLALPHMAATGVSGIDLYIRDRGRWRWLATARPTKFPTNEWSLVKEMTGGRHEYMLYLPLYNGVESVAIGLSEGATFVPGPRRQTGVRPVLVYGTSIVHGGCATRPGMAYPAIVGRKLDWPMINLGFSGNGRSEPEVARLLAELDPAVFVLDGLPNLRPAQVAERVGPFVDTIRKARPATPIVLVENVVYQNAEFIASRRESYQGKNAALRKIYGERIAAGDQNLYYIRAEELLGDDGEGTVDGTHPTDLGFLRMSEAVVRVVQPLLHQ
jgi:lysophospholipase L1-like esterase